MPTATFTIGIITCLFARHHTLTPFKLGQGLNACLVLQMGMTMK